MKINYQYLFENIRTAMVIIDSDGRIVDHNKAFRDLLGYTLEELHNTRPMDISPEYQPNGNKTEKQTELNVELAIRNGHHEFPWVNLRKDGTEVMSFVTVENIVIEGKMFLLLSLHHMSEEDVVREMIEKKKEEILEQNKEFESIFNNTVVGLIVTSENDEILKVNNRVLEIFESDGPEEVVGHYTREFYPSFDAFHEFIATYEKAVQENRRFKMDFEFRTVKGNPIWCTLARNAKDATRPLDFSKGMLWFIDDITDKKLLELKLKQQYLLAKDANPLTGLPGNNTIMSHLVKSVTDKTNRSMLYVDLDNFKAYNDRFGFARGDDVLKAIAGILEAIGVDYGIGDYFVGNVGGDDFVIIMDSDHLEDATAGIIHRFDKGIVDFYEEEDIRRGIIQIEDRTGQMKDFPIMSISLAGVRLRDVPSLSYLEVIDMCCILKKQAKEIEGSVFIQNHRII